jgi:hypothetical protein
MKVVPFDAFGSAQAVSYCANVADSALWLLAFCYLRWPGMQSSRQLVTLASPTKKSATSLQYAFRERVQCLFANDV